MRDLVRSRGLGDVYKRQVLDVAADTAVLVGVHRAVLIVLGLDSGDSHQLAVGAVEGQ